MAEGVGRAGGGELRGGPERPRRAVCARGVRVLRAAPAGVRAAPAAAGRAPVRPKTMLVKRMSTWSTSTKSKEMEAIFCRSVSWLGTFGLGIWHVTVDSLVPRVSSPACSQLFHAV
jgi:hypothetical protein